MAAEYYTAESVFSQLLQIAEIDPKYVPPPFPENWELCPCFKEQNDTCYNGHCRVKLGVFFHDPLLSRFPIEVIYIKQRHGGFIRADTRPGTGQLFIHMACQYRNSAALKNAGSILPVLARAQGK